MCDGPVCPHETPASLFDSQTQVLGALSFSFSHAKHAASLQHDLSKKYHKAGLQQTTKRNICGCKVTAARLSQQSPTVKQFVYRAILAFSVSLSKVLHHVQTTLRLEP